MKDAGYPQVPVIAASLQGLEDNPGFSLSAPMLHRFIQTMTVGDLLQKVVLRTRPYQIDGNVAALYNEWDRVSREFFENGATAPRWGGGSASTPYCVPSWPSSTQSPSTRRGSVELFFYKNEFALVYRLGDA